MPSLSRLSGLTFPFGFALLLHAGTSEALCTESYDWHDFPNGDQCVGAVEAFFSSHFSVSLPALCAYPTSSGCDSCGACELWVGDAPDPAQWDRMSSGTPQLFDMMVFPPPDSKNPYGHVAVVDHADSSGVYVMDDNYVGYDEKASCPHTVSWAPYGWYRLKSLENRPPQGWLDSASWGAISGWTYDPDTPTVAIDVDFYFGGAAGSGAPGVRALANVNRPDLCSAIGSCEHGFVFPTPLGMMDGAQHSVFAYGIDSSGDGDNPLLSGAPKSITCPPPKIPSSTIKRHVPNPTVLAAWHLVALTDLLHLPDAEVAAIADGPDTPAAPSLVEALYKGKSAVFLLDGETLRHVQDPASVTAWHFDPATLVVNPPADVADLPQGLPWPAAPFFVQSSTAIYMLDGTIPHFAHPDAGAPRDAAPEREASADDAGAARHHPRPAVPDAAPETSGGCSVTRAASAPLRGSLLAVAVGLLALRVRRRSSASRDLT